MLRHAAGGAYGRQLLDKKKEHKRKSSRDIRSAQETHLTNERIRAEQEEGKDFLKFRAEEALQGEQEALSRLSEVEFQVGVLLEEQRNQILAEEGFETP